jgi:hypothetical protein
MYKVEQLATKLHISPILTNRGRFYARADIERMREHLLEQTKRQLTLLTPGPTS